MAHHAMQGITFCIPRFGYRIRGTGVRIPWQWNWDSGFPEPVISGIPDYLTLPKRLLEELACVACK